MANNRYPWHLRIFVEDDANLQIVNGFLETFFHHNVPRCVRVLPPCGGWHATLNAAQKACVVRRPNQNILAVIDFDGDSKRIATATESQSANYYVVGSRDEPERLRQYLQQPGFFSNLGDRLACEYDCKDSSIWAHIVNRNALDSLVQDARKQHAC